MMDAAALYPRGFHPVQTRSLPDISGSAPVLPRSSVIIKYYFLDFGISTQFNHDGHPRLVVGKDGLERSVPELSDDVPYDPFKVDICILGAFFKQHMLDVGAIPGPTVLRRVLMLPIMHRSTLTWI